MTMKIIKPEDRAQEPVYSKGLIVGLPGAGKTYLLKTLDPKSTLFIDFEAGDMTVKDFPVEYTLRPKTWEDLRDIAVFFCGVNENAKEELKYKEDKYIPYSKKHYDYVVEKYKDDFAGLKDNVKTIFIDSMTDASKLCKRYTDAHPTSETDKGKFNAMSSYGLTKEELYNLVDTFQKTRNMNIWMLAQIGSKTDEFGKEVFFVDMEGSFKSTFPYMPDHVFYIERVEKEGTSWRQMLTSGNVSFINGLKLKSRADLEAIERPDLTYLMEKIKAQKTIKIENKKGDK